MKIKVLNEAGPNLKKAPAKITKDPWIGKEDIEPYDFQVRRFYMYFEGEMVKNKNSQFTQYKHNAYEVVEFVMEVRDDGEDVMISDKITVTTDPTKHKTSQWSDYVIIAEIYDGYKQEEEDMAKYTKPYDPETDQIDLDDRRFYLRKDEKFIYPENSGNKLWTANEIAALMWSLTDDELMENSYTARDKKGAAPEGVMTQDLYKDVSEIPAIEKASKALMKKAKEDPTFRPGKGGAEVDIPLQTIDGIKVRIGAANSPCPEWSPANSDKPFGNKQFDPQSPEGRKKGKWECNTEVEQVVLQSLEDFVTQNTKPEQEIINTLIQVARKSTPGEPLHPEEDIDTLFRGTSRESLTGAAFDPQAKDILQKIDFSKELNHFYYLKNKWVSFDYKGSFKMAFSVASWTNDMHTSAQFAKGGPSVNMKGARPFQFIYMTTPSAAKSVGGTFINFDELYELDGNTKAVGGNLDDNFHGFGGYQGFDKETLLIGQQGSSMPIESVYINWDYLTSEETLKIIKQGLPQIHDQLMTLMQKKPNLRKVAIFKEFERWAGDLIKEINFLWESWSKRDTLMNYIRDQETDEQRLILRLRKSITKGEIQKHEIDAKRIYAKIEKVRQRFSFESKGSPWAKDPEHPWHGVEHKFFMASGENKNDISETMLMMQEKVKALGTQTRGAMGLIWMGEKGETTTEIEEAKEPWYKTKTKDEIAKGMRGTLTGDSAGNKFMPATGMKDISTNKKSKSAPPNVGALEE